MSGVDDLFDQAKDLIGDHADDVKKGIKEAADFVDDTTGHEHKGTVREVEKAAKGFVDQLDDTPKKKKGAAHKTDAAKQAKKPAPAKGSKQPS